jgi:intracellular sulfur oxidation DsrE/DsrF family protein
MPAGSTLIHFFGVATMPVRFMLVFLLLSFGVPSLADEPSYGPIIEGYGPTYPINDRDVPLKKDALYKVVFDATDSPDEDTSLNPELVSVARFLNMHARNGVPPENMDIALVVHGAAWKSLLTQDAYQTRFFSDNPNYELLLKLDEAGVKIYVCGQTIRFGHVDRKELAAPVKVALSAMTMLSVLQSDGYALLP